MPAEDRTRGRIHPHQRNTDDAGDIVGANLELPEDFKAKFQETIKHDITDKCRADYRNRLKRIMKFWKEETPDMYAVGVVDVSELDQHDVSKHFFKGKYKLDLQYTGLNVDYVIYFMTKSKTKGTGKLKTLGDLRKYKDAIMWGSKVAELPLPTSFYRKFDTFLAGYRKEYVSNKSVGNTEDNTSDPIPYT